MYIFKKENKMANKYNTKEYIDRTANIIVDRIIFDYAHKNHAESDFFLTCLDNDIHREVNDLCNDYYLKNNGLSKCDVAIRCRELIQDIYNIYIGTGEFDYQGWGDTENRGIQYSFSNHKDPFSYGDDDKEQLSASLDTVCFAIASNQVDTLLDDILARFEYYKKPFSRPGLVKRRIKHSIWSPAQAIEKHNELLEV